MLEELIELGRSVRKRQSQICIEYCDVSSASPFLWLWHSAHWKESFQKLPSEGEETSLHKAMSFSWSGGGVTGSVQWPFGWGEWYTEWDNSEGPSQLSVGCWHLRGAVSVPLLPLSNAGSLTPSQMLLWVRFSINYLPANPPLRVWILGKPYLRQSLKLRKGVMEHSWKGFFWEQECINEDRHESVPQLGRILSWIKKHCYPNYS